jgi:hypothetical protein
VNFQQVIEVRPLTLAVVRFPTNLQGRLKWLTGLAHAARMKQEFTEPPVEIGLVLPGRRSLKAADLLDKSPRLSDQCLVFQAFHPVRELAVPAVPLDQRIVDRRTAQRVPEFGRGTLMGETMSDGAQALYVAVDRG